MLNALQEEARQRPIYIATMIVLLLSIPFLIAPELDLWASSLFYNDTDGFWAKSSWFFYRLRKLGIFTPRLIIILMATLMLASLFLPSLRRAFSLPKFVFLTLVAAIGPGLIVNGLLKAHWGRARPVQTDLFGGDWPYSEVWVIAGNCSQNCSFVSGEGSMSFWMLGLVILLPLGWRKAGFGILAVLAGLISLNRIAFGGHYLSDILLSWAITAWVMAVLYSLMFQQTQRSFSSQSIETAWDNANSWLQPLPAKLLGRLKKRAPVPQTRENQNDSGGE